MAPQEARGGGSAPTTSGGSSVWAAWGAWAPGRRDGAGGEDRQRLLELSPSATELLGSEGSGGPAQALRRARLRVGGMVCSACSGAVEGALRRTAGVESASVALATGECLVTYFDGLLSAEALAAAVEDAGFEASLVEDGKLPPPAGGAPAPDGGGGPRLTTLGLAVGGMTCSSCAGSVERALRAVPGVKGVAVNLLQNSAQVTFDPDATGPRTVLEAVEDAGFEARVEDQAGAGAGAGSRDASREEIRKWRRLLVQAAWLAAPLFHGKVTCVMGSWRLRSLKVVSEKSRRESWSSSWYPASASATALTMAAARDAAASPSFGCGAAILGENSRLDRNWTLPFS